MSSQFNEKIKHRYGLEYLDQNINWNVVFLPIIEFLVGFASEMVHF